MSDTDFEAIEAAMEQLIKAELEHGEEIEIGRAEAELVATIVEAILFDMM